MDSIVGLHKIRASDIFPLTIPIYEVWSCCKFGIFTEIFTKFHSFWHISDILHPPPLVATKSILSRLCGLSVAWVSMLWPYRFLVQIFVVLSLPPSLPPSLYLPLSLPPSLPEESYNFRSSAVTHCKPFLSLVEPQKDLSLYQLSGQTARDYR